MAKSQFGDVGRNSHAGMLVIVHIDLINKTRTSDDLKGHELARIIS
jgi:hypothetical protein